MTKDLMTIDPGKLPAHIRSETQSDEFGAGIYSGLDMPVLSIRGKEFRFRYQGVEQSTRNREIDVILLASRAHVSKRWYEDKYTPGSVEMPDCFSVDGITPSPTGRKVQARTCRECPRNVFGSRITPSGKPGKECGDYKRFVILPVLDGAIADTPVVLDLPFTSLKKLRDDRTDNMFLQEYIGALVRHQINVPGVVTRLAFTDAEYPQVCFAMQRYVEKDEWERIVALRESDEVKAALSDPQAEAPGAIAEAKPEAEDAPAPKPETKPEAKPDPEIDALANLLSGKEKKSKPAEAVEAKAEDEPSDAVMNEVRSLLKGLS